MADTRLPLAVVGLRTGRKMGAGVVGRMARRAFLKGVTAECGPDDAQQEPPAAGAMPCRLAYRWTDREMAVRAWAPKAAEGRVSCSPSYPTGVMATASVARASRLSLAISSGACIMPPVHVPDRVRSGEGGIARSEHKPRRNNGEIET